VSVSTPPPQTTKVVLPLATDAKQVLKAGDGAAAERLNLKPADFPAGWTSNQIDPADFAVCPDFHPDESRLTVNGLSTSPVFVTGDPLGASFQATAARVRIWRTPAEAHAAFLREAVRAQIQCIVEDPGGPDYTIAAAGALHFHGLGRSVRGFRVVVRDNQANTLYFLDVVLVVGKRSLTTLVFESSGTPSSFEQSLLARIAARAARV
jgi:hypothetical protein